MGYIGYMIIGLLAFILGVLIAQLTILVKKIKRENDKDEW